MITNAMRISATGMTAERFRMDVISVNIANVNSVAGPGRPPYQARHVELIGDENGVRISRIVPDEREFRRVLDPGNPLADSEGKVTYSNVEPVEQMVNLIGASRSYEANVAAFNSARQMMRTALTIGRNA
jgi:flagellar basal-body rod protein FlgC